MCTCGGWVCPLSTWNHPLHPLCQFTKLKRLGNSALNHNPVLNIKAIYARIPISPYISPSLELEFFFNPTKFNHCFQNVSTSIQKIDVRIYNNQFKHITSLFIIVYITNSQLDFNTWNALSYRLKQLTIALPDRLPVMLAPAKAMVLAVSLRLSRMAPILSIWLPLALRLPVNPTLSSPILGLWRASATDVVSKMEKGIYLLLKFHIIEGFAFMEAPVIKTVGFFQFFKNWWGDVGLRLIQLR